MKILLCFLIKMNHFVLFMLLSDFASAEKHSLQYYLVSSSGLSNFPEFVALVMVDGIQGGYCDSSGRRPEPKKWAEKIVEDDPHVVEHYTHECMHFQYTYRAHIDTLKQQLNQTGGIHVFQRMHGCGWDDETGEVRAFNQFGYDGEDFISLDPTTLTWVAAKPQALITKHKWDKNIIELEIRKLFNKQLCPEKLKRYLGYLKRFHWRAERPSVFLLQKTPSSPVSCHATGFYPYNATVFWRKDGQELHKDVEYMEILPNHDGTFQMNSDLDVSSVAPEDWRRYDCVFHHPGVQEDIVIRLDKAVIKTNWVSPTQFPVGPVCGGVVGLLLLALLITGLFIWKRNHNGFKPANSSDSSSCGTTHD